MICTDRNSVTPHPNAVPLGYLQVENGLTIDKLHRGGDFNASESVVRLGTWLDGELRFQCPNYFRNWGFAGRQEGTADIQVAIKQDLEPHVLNKKGLDVGVIAGMSIPTGSRYLSTRHVDPFVQMIAFQKFCKYYTLGTSHSIFMPYEVPNFQDPNFNERRKHTYQATVILFRSLGDRVDVWGEYAGQFFDRYPSNQIMDFGAVWRPKNRHQVDCRFGVGLTNAAPRAFIGVGYSILVGKILPWGKRL